MPKNTDIPLGWTYTKRKHFLEELIKKPLEAKYTYPLRFQGNIGFHDVYTVEIDLPKYRLANGRTQAAQEMYLAKNPHLGNDFFSRDLESEEAQSIQHDLLWRLVEHEDLYTYFKNPQNAQEQPLILSDFGFVVNGNRRLCAMRELFYSDRTEYSRYSHIDVVILSHCSDRDIDELEAYLQIQPEIKQSYSWISKACMLRARQQRYNYSFDELEILYGMKAKEIESIFSQLAMVDQYLESRGKSKQYELVEGDDYAFKQLVKLRPQLKQPEKKDIFTQISYVLIDGDSEVSGRLYERIPEVKENLPSIINALNDELKPEVINPAETDTYDIFGNNDNNNNLIPLIKAVEDLSNRQIVVDTVLDVIDSEKEINRRKIKANAVLKQVSEANSHLINAINYIDVETSKVGIEEQIQAIEKNIVEIRNWLSKNARD